MNISNCPRAQYRFNNDCTGNCIDFYISPSYTPRCQSYTIITYCTPFNRNELVPLTYKQAGHGVCVSFCRCANIPARSTSLPVYFAGIPVYIHLYLPGVQIVWISRQMNQHSHRGIQACKYLWECNANRRFGISRYGGYRKCFDVQH